MHLPRIPCALRYPLAVLAVAPLAAQEEAGFRRDLERLTAPALEGRGVGSQGGELAIEYIAGAMEEAGLRPWVQGTMRQEFQVPASRATFTEDTGIRVYRGGTFHPLRIGEEALPFRFSADGRVRAPVVFAGYGVQIPALGHDDYADLDVEGKVVLVLRGAPNWRQPDSPYLAHRRELQFRSKLARAQAAGAVGLLLCESDPGESSQPSLAEDISIALRTQGRVGIPALWITRAAALALGGGELGFSGRERKLAQGNASALGPIPDIEVELEVRMGPRRPPLRTANVIGWLPGSDPDLAREYVVIGAHHDHLGRGRFGSLGGLAAVGSIHPGANDNASGVAGLLELARTMARGVHPRRSVLFVAFGAKEYDREGSRHFLSHAPVSAEKIVAMVNLDMIGRAESCALRVEGTASGKGLRQLLEGLRPGSGLSLRLGRSTSSGSDHREFLEKGIPSLLFHTGLYDQYRTPADVSCLVQVTGAVEVLRLVGAVVRDLADMAGRLEFTGSGRHP